MDKTVWVEAVVHDGKWYQRHEYVDSLKLYRDYSKCRFLILQAIQAEDDGCSVYQRVKATGQDGYLLDIWKTFDTIDAARVALVMSHGVEL